MTNPGTEHLVDEQDDEDRADDPEHRTEPRKGQGETPESVVPESGEANVGCHDRQRPVLERQVVVPELAHRGEHDIDRDADAHEDARKGDLDPKEPAGHQGQESENGSHEGPFLRYEERRNYQSLYNSTKINKIKVSGT